MLDLGTLQLKMKVVGDDVSTKLNEVKQQSENTSKSVDNLGNSAKSTSSKFDAWKVAIGNLIAQGLMKLTQSAINVAKDIVKTGEAFEASMSRVKAVSGASSEQMELLEAKAREMGATTVFSASEAADALYYMSLAG